MHNFQINVLIQFFVSSTCFEHHVFIIRKTICTCVSSTSFHLLDCLHQCTAHIERGDPVTGPVWPRGFQEVKAPRFPWHSAHEGTEVISLTHRPPLPPGNVPGTHFHYGLSQPQGHGAVGRNMSLENPVTPTGIDPGTFRLVVQRLNHYATPGPSWNTYHTKMYKWSSWWWTHDVRNM